MGTLSFVVAFDWRHVGEAVVEPLDGVGDEVVDVPEDLVGGAGRDVGGIEVLSSALPPTDRTSRCGSGSRAGRGCGGPEGEEDQLGRTGETRLSTPRFVTKRRTIK